MIGGATPRRAHREEGQRRTCARQPLVTIRSRSRKKRRTSNTPGPVPFTRSALHDRTPITTRRADSREVAEREARVAGAGRDLDVGGDHPDPLLVRVMVTGSIAASRWPGALDLSAAARDLGWAPRVEFAAAVAAYRDWLDASGT